MLEKYKKRANSVIGLTIGLTVLFLIPVVFLERELPLIFYQIGGFLIFLGYMVSYWNYAKAKGYPGAVGFVGVTGVGLIVLVMLRDKYSRSEEKRTKSIPIYKKRFGSYSSIIVYSVIVVIGVALLVGAIFLFYL